MRYEPGNWGDVLKGLWIESIVRLRSAEVRPFRVCDGFAGHPVYPLAPGSRVRLEELGGDHPYVRLQCDYAARGELASAATLARDALRRAGDAGARVTVFDLEAQKREHYLQLDGFALAEIEDGFAILAPDFRREFDLLVLDPYEFLWRYEHLLPEILAAAADTDVLLYLFDKAPTSGRYRRNVTNFLHDLDSARPDGSYLLGRAPADGFLPLIYHEMLYLPSAGLQAAPELGRELRRRTQQLARHIEDQHKHLRGRLGEAPS